MRHFSLDDERFLVIRSLAVDYSAGGREARHSHAFPQFLYARSGAMRVLIVEAHIQTHLEGLMAIPPEKPKPKPIEYGRDEGVVSI